MTQKTNLFFDWGVSDHYGWGVYGFNLLFWSRDNPLYTVLPLRWPPEFLLPPDPLTVAALRALEVSWGDSVKARDGDVVLHFLGNQIIKQDFKKNLKEIGIIFFESNPLPQQDRQRLRRFDGIIAGSTWNQDKLAEMDVPSRLVFQGIDTDLFRPQNKRIFRDRFVVFSGGKLEHRKGQDQLVKAFSIFAETHPDALLISAWRSPWEKNIAGTVNKSGLCEDLVPLEDMGMAISNWVGANGIRPDQFKSLDSVPNRLMPDVYREVDLAVFPNRCEGGTNLVAMEALSSGVPCVIANNTGQMDLIKDNNCLTLTEQLPITDPALKFSEDWRDSSVDEIVALMEAAYDNKAILETSQIRDSMIGFTWENSIATLIKTIDEI